MLTTPMDDSAPPIGLVAPRQRSANPLVAAFSNTGFIVCVAMLVAFAAGFQWIVRDLHIDKLPVDLRKPLAMLDQAKLAPYERVHAADIKPEILDALGTRMYIQWTLEDTRPAKRNLPESIIQLFVTYYTDNPGQIPHIPEECYLGSGYQVIRSDLIELPIPELGYSVPVKVLVFESSKLLQRDSKTVMYTFHSNGAFAADRGAVKARVGDPRSAHAYFSKLEVSFGTSEAVPSQEKAVEAGKQFLQKVIPVLVQEHWPDWDAVEKQEHTDTAPAGPEAESPVTESVKP